MNARAALQNGARASAIEPNNKGHSKSSRAEAGKGTYTQFEPARTHTQLYNLKVVPATSYRSHGGRHRRALGGRRGRAFTRATAAPRWQRASRASAGV